MIKKRPISLFAIAAITIAVLLGGYAAWIREASHPLAITLTKTNLPLLSIEIENQTYKVVLDLGTSCPLNLEQNSLSKLTKQRYGVSRWRDCRGKSHKADSYVLPAIKIGKKTFHNIITHADNPLCRAGHILWTDDSPPDKLEGFLGDFLLYRTDILLDFPRGFAYISPTAADFSHADLDLHTMQKVALEKGFSAIISVETDLGVKRFLIDSGCTVTCLPYLSTEPAPPTCTSRFVIAGHDFGPRTIYFFEMDFKNSDIDGLIGMDFLLKHPLYINYEQGIAAID